MPRQGMTREESDAQAARLRALRADQTQDAYIEALRLRAPWLGRGAYLSWETGRARPSGAAMVLLRSALPEVEAAIAGEGDTAPDA